MVPSGPRGKEMQLHHSGKPAAGPERGDEGKRDASGAISDGGRAGRGVSSGAARPSAARRPASGAGSRTGGRRTTGGRGRIGAAPAAGPRNPSRAASSLRVERFY